MITPVTNSNNHYPNPISNNNQATGSTATQAPPQDASATVTISPEARQLSEGALDGLSSSPMARELPQELWGAMSQGSRNRWLESQTEFQQTFNQVSTEHSARLLAEQFRTQLFLNLTYNPEVRAFHEAGNIVFHGQLAEDFERFNQLLNGEATEANPSTPPVEMPEYSNVSDIPAFDSINLANQNNTTMLELFNSLNNTNTQNNTEEDNPIMRIFGAHNLA